MSDFLIAFPGSGKDHPYDGSSNHRHRTCSSIPQRLSAPPRCDRCEGGTELPWSVGRRLSAADKREPDQTRPDDHHRHSLCPSMNPRDHKRNVNDCLQMLHPFPRSGFGAQPPNLGSLQNLSFPRSFKLRGIACVPRMGGPVHSARCDSLTSVRPLVSSPPPLPQPPLWVGKVVRAGPSARKKKKKKKKKMREETAPAS